MRKQLLGLSPTEVGIPVDKYGQANLQISWETRMMTFSTNGNYLTLTVVYLSVKKNWSWRISEEVVIHLYFILKKDYNANISYLLLKSNTITT